MPADSSRAAAACDTPGVTPLLVFAYGNPSRRDDALGPAFIDQIAKWATVAGQVELLTDFQLQVEHTLDLVGRHQVVFVDASISCGAPFTWHVLAPARDASYSSHVMSPAALLQAYVDVLRHDPPRCYLLTIRGYEYELGQPLSVGAQSNLDAALRFMAHWIEQARTCRDPLAAAGHDALTL